MAKKRLYGAYAAGSAEEECLKLFKEWIATASIPCESEHNRCEDNARFERGEQWSMGDAQRQQEKERPALPLNSIHKLLNAVANKEIMDRFVPKVYARGREDEGIAEILDSAMQWSRDQGESEHEESMAFRKLCGSGYGVMHKYFDTMADDGDGRLIDEEIPIWYMLWDPMARKQNLVDRKYHLCGKYVDINAVESMVSDMPRTAKTKFAQLKMRSKIAEEDHYGGTSSDTAALPGGTWGQIRSGKWMSISKDSVFMVEGEWIDRRSYYRVAYPVRLDEVTSMLTSPDGSISMQDGSTISNQQYMQMPPQDQHGLIMNLLSDTEIMKFDRKEDFASLSDQYRSVTGVDFEDYYNDKKEVVKYGIVVDDVVFDCGERSYGFTFEFMTGFPFETRERMQFYGMIDVAKAPQDFKNVFYSNLLTMYMTSPKQHLVVEEGALKDIQQFLTEYSKTSGVSIVPDGFVKGERFLQMDSPHFPPMLESLVGIVNDNVQEIFGLSSIEQGSQGDLRRVSGNVVQAAKAASNTLLAILFDGLRRYRKRWGMLTVKSILEFYQPTDILKIIGDSAEYLPEAAQFLQSGNQWPANLKFDIKIDESPTSISEQMQTVDYLTRNGAIQEWVQSGDLPFNEALDLMVTIPKSTRERIKKARAEQKDTQAQIQDLQMQIQKQAQVMDLFRKFVQTQESGGDMLAKFDLVYALSDQMLEEKQRQEQALQQEQQNGTGQSVG